VTLRAEMFINSALVLLIEKSSAGDIFEIAGTIVHALAAGASTLMLLSFGITLSANNFMLFAVYS
jgi:hypothetical protein